MEQPSSMCLASVSRTHSLRRAGARARARVSRMTSISRAAGSSTSTATTGGCAAAASARAHMRERRAARAAAGGCAPPPISILVVAGFGSGEEIVPPRSRSIQPHRTRPLPRHSAASIYRAAAAAAAAVIVRIVQCAAEVQDSADFRESGYIAGKKSKCRF